MMIDFLYNFTSLPTKIIPFTVAVNDNVAVKSITVMVLSSILEEVAEEESCLHLLMDQ